MTVQTYRKALVGMLLASTFLLGGWLKEAKAEPVSTHNFSAADLLLHSSKLDATAQQAIADTTASIVADLPTDLSTAAPAAIDVAQGTDDTFSPLTEEEIRQRLLIDPNGSVDFDSPRPVPSSSFLTPSAYGADWGDAFIGVAGAAGGNLRDVDGSASLGIGFGDAVRNVGVEVSTSIISLDGFAEDGTVGVKIHKVFPQANNLAVAVGWSNPISWGSANQDQDIFYGVATQQFALRPNRNNQMPLTVSAGIGTGTFRSAGAIAVGNNDPNIFGSASIRVIPQVSFISSWTGSGLGLAASAAPFDFPLIFTAGVSDLTDNTAEGTRFQGSMGYSFSF